MKSANGRRLYIEEVAPLGGFQIESHFVPTERALDRRVDEFNHVMVQEISDPALKCTARRGRIVA